LRCGCCPAHKPKPGGSHFVELQTVDKELPRPAHGFYVLPTSGPRAHSARAYLDAMRNAANFAFGNRLFLGLMMLRVCRRRWAGGFGRAWFTTRLTI
jgi:hypothetical protein